MYRSISPGEMRRVVLDGFQQHLPRRLTVSDLEIRARIEDGRVAAYSYRVDNLFAMWMIEVGLIQFYDDDGNLLQAVDLPLVAQTDRRAA